MTSKLIAERAFGQVLHERSQQRRSVPAASAKFFERDDALASF